MRGLSPRIHADWLQIDRAAWIAGSSPAKTRGALQQFNSEPPTNRPATAVKSATRWGVFHVKRRTQVSIR